MSCLRSSSGITGSIPFIATLLIVGLGVSAPTSTARAKDCLAAPNSPAPEGSWWYYRLDWPTQRKCWYLRALGKPAQQTTERATASPLSPVRSWSAPSESTRPPDRASTAVSTGESVPSPTESAPVSSIVPEVVAPPAAPLLQTNTPTSAPTPNETPVITTSSEPIVQQNAHAEITIQSFPETVQSAASSQPDSQAGELLPADSAALTYAVPRIKALESSAVATDASTPDYIERVVRSREQANGHQIPIILFLVIPVGLAVVGISSHFSRVARVLGAQLKSLVTDVIFISRVAAAIRNKQPIPAMLATR